MPRKNPEVQRLEREVELLTKKNAMLESTFLRMRSDPGDLPVHGCSDYGCVVSKPTGMGTNGGCHCTERVLRVAVQYYKHLNLFRLDTIQLQKDENAKLRDDNLRLENELYLAKHVDANV